MRELSIFIDESGDFGVANRLPSYYLTTFVFHEQNKSISKQVEQLENRIKNNSFNIEYLHSMPIIRKESIFDIYSLDDRRKLLYCMLNFTMSCPITHYTVSVDRKIANDKISLSGKLSKEITQFIDKNYDYFLQYDRIVVYYDNGQIELSSILNAIFSAHLNNVEFRKAMPQKYKLLQVADFICTIELLNIKRNSNTLNSSEKKFFYKSQELKKTFIKAINKKHFEN